MKYISSNEKILSGTPVIAGTRIPITRIVFLLKQGYTLEDIHNEYDHVTVKTLEGVLEEMMHLVEKSPYGSKTA